MQLDNRQLRWKMIDTKDRKCKMENDKHEGYNKGTDMEDTVAACSHLCTEKA